MALWKHNGDTCGKMYVRVQQKPAPVTYAIEKIVKLYDKKLALLVFISRE